MGVTKTIQGSTNNSNWTFKTVVTETSTNIADMTSVVEVENFLGRSSSSSYFAGDYTVKYEAGGQSYSEDLYKSSGTISAGNYVSLGKHSFTIKHNTEPTTITVKGSMSTSNFSPSSASAEGSVTLTELHKAPAFTNATFEEQNTLLVNAGVGGDYFVPFLSKKKATISASAYDNATIKEYKIINETNVFTSSTNEVTMDFTKNSLYWFYYEFEKRNVAKLTIKLTDSLGAVATVAYPYNYIIPYTKPNLIPTSSSVKRKGQLTGKVNLNLTGTFYNDKVGNVSNGITLSFKYWKVGTTEPSTYYTIPESAYTISGNNISISNWNIAKDGTVIEDVDKSSAYKFKIKVVDSFNSSSEIELTCSKGEWLMAKFKDRIDFKKITINGEDPFKKSAVTIISYNESHTGSKYTFVRIKASSAKKVGDGFSTTSDSTIVANKDMQAVIVAASLSLTAESYSYSGDLAVRHMRDTSVVQQYEVRGYAGSGQKMVSLPQGIFTDIKAGDYFDFAHYTGSETDTFTTVNNAASYLTVQEL